MMDDDTSFLRREADRIEKDARVTGDNSAADRAKRMRLIANKLIGQPEFDGSRTFD